MSNGEQTNEGNDTGKKPDTISTEDKSNLSVVENANKAAERLEAANAKQEELLSRQENLMAEQALGGQTIAGQAPTKPISPEDQKKANAKEMFKGTALEGAIDKL